MAVRTRPVIFIAILAALVLLFPNFAAATFPDVSSASYYYQAITRLSSLNPAIVSGFPNGSFNPEGELTRAQFAKIIVAAKKFAGETTDTGNLAQSSFSDVRPDYWAYEPIEEARQFGIVTGYPNGTFEPEAPITRAELVTMIIKSQPDWPLVETATPTFADVSLWHWAFEAVETAYKNALIKGNDDGTFRPEDKSTRGQAAAMIYRLLFPSNGLVVLDPGHGGVDPGASANGLVEKEINLAVALKLKVLLEQAGFKVIMTRSSDVTLTLQRRVDIANNSGADVFVAIHHNSINIPSIKGIEVLYYPSSTKGRQLAELIEQELVKALGTNSRGIKDREGLFVLRYTDMPAVISEGGYLTNSSDSALLKTDSYRQKEAVGIFNGIVKYFAEAW